eukprot:m51a1_g4962 hypothetical protein (203) ;mRNA; r:366442-367050
MSIDFVVSAAPRLPAPAASSSSSAASPSPSTASTAHVVARLVALVRASPDSRRTRAALVDGLVQACSRGSLALVRRLRAQPFAPVWDEISHDALGRVARYVCAGAARGDSAADIRDELALFPFSDGGEDGDGDAAMTGAEGVLLVASYEGLAEAVRALARAPGFELETPSRARRCRRAALRAARDNNHADVVRALRDFPLAP